MIPILYSGTETAFSNNGIGMLFDAISCLVTEERNGAYELNMQYPISGIHFSDIALRSIILAKPNKTSQEQPFRVYRMTRPINGVVEIYAEHISYDLSGIPIKPFTSISCKDAMAKLKSNAVTSCPFTFTTDKDTAATMDVIQPCSLRSQLGGKTGSILDVYGGGEYEFDRYTVRLYQNRGQNNGVSIRYGKNLTDLKQEQNCANVYTGVYPFWINPENGNVMQLTEKIVPVSGTFSFSRIMVLDLSMEWQEQPTEAQLRARTQSYIVSNSIGVPTINLDVSFAQLEQSEEYKDKALLERVSLCDTVNVYFEKLGVNATAKAIKLVYNVLIDRIESIELGDSRTKLTDSILAQEIAVEEVPTASGISAMIQKMTSTILGANGGSVRMLDTNDDGEPDTLYIADDADPTKAVKVWRWNYEGWGASKNGYNGPFVMGATLEDGILADKITAGYLSVDRIKGNSVGVDKLTGEIKNNNWLIDLTAGTLTIGNISANNIKTGTLDASLIAAHSINVSQLKGNISNGLWKIDLDNGTMTTGNLSVDALSAAGVITSIGKDGIKITHSQLQNCYTVIDASGLKMFNASNKQLGGITTINGSVVTATQVLYNPIVSTLNVDIGSGLYGSEDGLAFKLGNTSCFELTGAQNTFRLKTSDGAVMLYGSGGGLGASATTISTNASSYSLTANSSLNNRPLISYTQSGGQAQFINPSAYYDYTSKGLYIFSSGNVQLNGGGSGKSAYIEITADGDIVFHIRTATGIQYEYSARSNFLPG